MPDRNTEKYPEVPGPCTWSIAGAQEAHPLHSLPKCSASHPSKQRFRWSSTRSMIWQFFSRRAPQVQGLLSLVVALISHLCSQDPSWSPLASSFKTPESWRNWRNPLTASRTFRLSCRCHDNNTSIYLLQVQILLPSISHRICACWVPGCQMRDVVGLGPSYRRERSSRKRRESLGMWWFSLS